MMKQEKPTLRFRVTTLIVLFAALCRLISHPNNFAPIGAMALFGATSLFFSGLTTCYVAGIPFFHNTILGDFIYVGAMFGIFKWCIRRISQLKLSLAVLPND